MSKPLRIYPSGKEVGTEASEKHKERLAVFRGDADRAEFVETHGHAPEHVTFDELGGWGHPYPAEMGKHLVPADVHIHEKNDGYYVIAPGAQTNGRCHSGHCK